MNAHQLIDLLLSRLVRAHGGERRRWRLVIGPVRIHSVETHPHCNWSVAPSGSARETGLVERLLDEVRVSHPIVSR
ncbi:hypothetical protein [Rhizorhabdus dicambivorans]|uniref:Uncharacterized protein n=1 Tax=Rhizorhabdus dicambivorans TaxID=1850238 RepID=A0A2A4FTF1_9SPHN|nr:hypothetical protein [Rhizorhabdus dicambivorans]ATE65633.1 hypothetical protein CMV14_15485 [Rhizorhabdus dicambivorans]PCE40974.1 hypothetical protein COO09_17395 [Rhizorhabdus dicambivorans]